MSASALSISLTAVQNQVIATLAGGASLSDAAAQAGIHRNTIANWRRASPEFRAELAQALYDRALLVREQAEALASDALTTIREILTDSKAPASVRLRAALAILQLVSTPPPDPPLLGDIVHSNPVHKHAQIPTPEVGQTPGQTPSIPSQRPLVSSQAPVYPSQRSSP